MFFPRQLAQSFRTYLKQYPIVSITGPRQSGKTTLAKKIAQHYQYISLEDPDHREYALTDPRGFLSVYSRQVIFDEIQKAPKLFSYLQSQVDHQPEPGRFIITGSQQFLLNKQISQTLSGRVARLTLLPLSLAELHQRPKQDLWFSGQLEKIQAPNASLYHHLITGLYPRIYEHQLSPYQFYRDYVDTYVTRDLQQLIKVGDLRLFHIFLRMLAARCGQKVNLTALGNDLGLSHVTIRRWLSVLEASYIIRLLEPYYKNFNKRLIKSPKIYFLDTGLLCYLLRIQREADLPYHTHIGGIFETFVISELVKTFYHQDQSPPLYFWQEKSGKEIDVIIDHGLSNQLPLEIKASQTVTKGFFTNLIYWRHLDGNHKKTGYLVYGGDQYQLREHVQVLPWYAIS
ncbi:ATP-binding protein [Gammaproteobacteria bacterium]|nr:ATP-binding protein [Gammaproteobacteria bacterium]